MTPRTVITAVLLCIAARASAQTIVINGQEQQPNVTVRAKAKKEKPAPPPKAPEEPTFKVYGGFETTKEKARESAIRAAMDKVQEHMAKQSPPVFRPPTIDLVRRMILEDQDEVTEQTLETDKKETMYRVTVAVKVRPENVREMRSRERSADALWVLAGMGGIAAVCGLFFRIDSWTKGYLTSWLVLGTVGTAALVGGLWWWAK